MSICWEMCLGDPVEPSTLYIKTIVFENAIEVEVKSKNLKLFIKMKG